MSEPLGGHEVVLEGVILDRFTDDRLTERVRLARARLDRREAVAHGEAAEVAVFGDASREARVRATAPEARVFLRERLVEMEGGVSITDAAGRVLRTDRLSYDAKRDAVHSTGPVSVEGANFRATGTSLRGHPKRGTIEVAGPVSATFHPGE